MDDFRDVTDDGPRSSEFMLLMAKLEGLDRILAEYRRDMEIAFQSAEKARADLPVISSAFSETWPPAALRRPK